MSGRRVRVDGRGEASLDPRVRRTQAALLAAFNRLFLAHGYEAITPARIASEAGVGRSTFYEHHAGKEALLKHSVAPLLQHLAEASVGPETPLLIGTLRHFWDNRRLARRLIAGRTGTIIRDQLAELIAHSLNTGRAARALPPQMIAVSVAAAELALIEAWLSGRYTCTAEMLAQAIAGSQLWTPRCTARPI